MSQQDITEPKVFLGAYVKRMSSTFGLNSNPTTIELELIEGNPLVAYDVARNATGWITSSGIPGKLHRFNWGSLDFVGLLQSWNRSYSSAGWSYSVRLADPRIALNNIPLILNGYSALPSGTQLANYLNVFNYYGTPEAADSTENGMPFHKIKTYLESTGIFTLYNNPFRILFSSGFMSTSGTSVISGIPVWYRVPGAQTTLDQLMNQVSNDFNMDWYCYIVPTGYTPNGVNTLFIDRVSRNISTSTDIDTFVTTSTSNGTLINYKRGQELRSDPITAVLEGSNLTYWQGANYTDVSHYWGRYDDGTAITTPYNASYGIVRLDNTVGTGNLILQPFWVTLNTTTYTKTSAVNVYPPSITKVASTAQVTGYQPTFNTMRAALWSQSSWETALFKEHEALARVLGITQSPFVDSLTYLTNPEIIKHLYIVGTGVSDQTDVQKQLTQSVYNATKQVADTYWGKSWMVKLPDSAWLASATYNRAEVFPRIEYSIADSAWSQSDAGMPSGVTNHVLLNQCTNPRFKDSTGRLKAFCSFTDYDTTFDNSAAYPDGFPYVIDLKNVPRDGLFIEQGPKLCVPISVQQYEISPDYAIVDLPFPIQAQLSSSGYEYKTAFYQFLLYMGFSHDVINSGNLMSLAVEMQDFGLAPPRLVRMKTAPGNYGIHIPLVSNTQSFGPFFATGTVAGPVTYIKDDSLGPWTYGSYASMNIAGQTLANRALSTTSIVDNAELNIAGLPQYNIGADIGASASINGISIQVGQDGLTTNYTVRTYAYPPGRITKLLTDRISQQFLDLPYNTSEKTRIFSQAELDADGFNLNSPQRIDNAIPSNTNQGFIVGFP